MQRRVRDGLPPPPFCLLLQRLPSRIQVLLEKIPRFRGVLGWVFGRIRTGDGRFGAQIAPQPEVISDAKLDGWMSGGIQTDKVGIRILLVRH